MGCCILQRDSYHGYFLSLKEEMEGKRAEKEQVPLPATSLIARVLSQIPNQTNITAAGIQMR